jgi:hypothetical protein
MHYYEILKKDSNDQVWQKVTPEICIMKVLVSILVDTSTKSTEALLWFSFVPPYKISDRDITPN